MSKLLNILKILFKPKTKRTLTPAEKQAIEDQVIIIDPITRGK